MTTYDWIVIGGGIAGACAGYELARKGMSVLLLEQDATLQGATRWSYGGLAFWSGRTPMTRALCQEGIQRYRQLEAELEHDIEFRELDLLMAIPPGHNPTLVAASFAAAGIPPRLVDVDTACQMEPLLDRSGLVAALTVKHGHVRADATAHAFRAACQRLGGSVRIAQVSEVVWRGSTGVVAGGTFFGAANVLVCAGGLSRALLQQAGIGVQTYFTHAELIEIPPVDLRLNTLVMPAPLLRFDMEVAATQDDRLWDAPGHEPAPAILDPGIVQFRDGSIRIGQISRALTDPYATVDAATSEHWIRSEIGRLMPAIAALPGSWQHCLVGFCQDQLPLIGEIPDRSGIWIFSGFSNPMVFVPAFAQRFANHVAGHPDPDIGPLSPARFALAAR